MNRIAVLLDAGYFRVQVGNLIEGEYTTRSKVQINYSALRDRMIQEIERQIPASHLLRVYWYDGPGQNGKTKEHEAIDQLDDFKLRLGTRNGTGQQKGVDGLIIADLISLTQQRAITHAVLLSGDSDIAPGVIAAQGMGLRVHLLSIGSSKATSPILAAEVDLKRAWSASDVQTFAKLSATSTPKPSAISGQSVTTGLGAIAKTPAADLPPSEIGKSSSITADDLARNAMSKIKAGSNANQLLALNKTTKRIPKEIDTELLMSARAHYNRSLTESEKTDLRRAFRAQLPAA